MFDQFIIGGHRNFTYLITFGGESVVIDPQRDLSPWQERLTELGSKLTGVLLTHTHWDHTAGVAKIIGKYGAVPIYVHALDAGRIETEVAKLGGRLVHVSDGQELTVGSQPIQVLHTPGHSAGECCYFVETKDASHLFTGDTVFVGDVGRTDLETGSAKEMFSTLQRLKKLPPETIIYPGHHYGLTRTSTLAQECAQSTAFRCKSVEELDAIP